MASDSYVMANVHQLKTHTFHKSFFSCHIVSKNGHITGFVTKLTLSLLEQELPTLPEHLGSATVRSGIRITRSLVLCVCFVDRCLYFCTFSFGHYVLCSSIYGF